MTARFSRLRITFLSLVALIFALAFVVPTANAADWEELNRPGFVPAGFLQLANYATAADDGDPYMIYHDVDEGGEDARFVVKKHEGGSWDEIGSFPAPVEVLFKPGLAFGPDGAVFISHVEENSDWRATVKKYDGDSWETLGEEGFTPPGSTGAKLAVSDGQLYALYFYEADGGEGDFGTGEENLAAVARYDGSGWETLGEVNFSAEGKIASADLAVHNGTPYVLYSKQREDGPGFFQLGVEKYEGGSWQPVGEPDAFNASYINASLTISENGELFVAYGDQGPNNENPGRTRVGGELQASDTGVTVKRFGGSGEWQTLGEPRFSAYSTSRPLISVIDSVPYVFFSQEDPDTEEDVSKVMRYTGTEWQPVPDPGVSGSSGNFSLFADKSRVYLSYLEMGESAGTAVKALNGAADYNYVEPANDNVIDVLHYNNGSQEYRAPSSLGNSKMSREESLRTLKRLKNTLSQLMILRKISAGR